MWRANGRDPARSRPKTATTSAACAPKINSDANSITKDGGIVARLGSRTAARQWPRSGRPPGSARRIRPAGGGSKPTVLRRHPAPTAPTATAAMYLSEEVTAEGKARQRPYAANYNLFRSNMIGSFERRRKYDSDVPSRHMQYRNGARDRRLLTPDDAVHLAELGGRARDPALHELEEHDRLRLVDFEEHRGVDVDADQHHARIVRQCRGAGHLPSGTTPASQAPTVRGSCARSRLIVAMPDTDTHSRVRSL